MCVCYRGCEERRASRSSEIAPLREGATRLLHNRVLPLRQRAVLLVSHVFSVHLRWQFVMQQMIQVMYWQSAKMLEINVWFNELCARMLAYNVFSLHQGSHFRLYEQRPPLLLWRWISCERAVQQKLVQDLI